MVIYIVYNNLRLLKNCYLLQLFLRYLYNNNKTNIKIGTVELSVYIVRSFGPRRN